MRLLAAVAAIVLVITIHPATGQTFAPGADFHRRQVEDPKNLTLLREALYTVTGQRLAVATALADGAPEHEPATDEQLSEDDVISLLKDTFDATELEDA
jgi:hypothetical protein